MSFRELRNFTEMMRSLGYERPVSVENFRTPNFELVADLLIWMSRKYDPSIALVEEIDTEDDRIKLLSAVCSSMLSKARIKLNAKKLYASDGYAVKELLKIATLLYNASRIDPNAIEEDDDVSNNSILRSKLKDTKATRLLSTEITDSGAKLFDLLENEVEIRETRQNALRFLDAVSSNLESTSEYKYLEKSIQNIITSVQENIEAMGKQCNDLEADEKALATKIKKKQNDLERGEKRLRSLKTVRPAFMDEYEKLEKDLESQYAVYCERFRNLDYLQHELDLYNNQEQEKIKESDRSLKRMQKRLRDEELRILRGEQEDGNDEFVDDRRISQDKNKTQNKSKKPSNRDFSDSSGSNGESGSEESSNDSATASESDEVSVADSGESDLIENDDETGSDKDSESFSDEGSGSATESDSDTEF